MYDYDCKPLCVNMSGPSYVLYVIIYVYDQEKLPR